ncbi:MAG: sigma-70 family RNA polymerase sigma factor, partial [Clostridia bacterium]|nr:sigma-70 family RNA polymerase sigma factor [Clostridia bacterium]
QTADGIITEYLPKLYGFAVQKTFLYDEAEELCGEIVYQVYLALRKADGIFNLDGYIRRIARYTYAKYVASRKKHAGVSIDEMEIPYEEDFLPEDGEEEILRLRREVAFLSGCRRKIVYLFYYRNKSIQQIAEQMHMPEGTVKWHLHHARHTLKEGFAMERKIGKLGLAPVTATCFGHSGNPGDHAAPEDFLGDKINLNIVYSVYHTPRTKEEIAEELGMTLVFIEEKIDYLEDNGFLVKTAGGRYTTYVRFSPETWSLEALEKERKLQLEAAALLVKEYVPLVRAAVADVQDVYIPGGNRELLEAAAIVYGIVNRCNIPIQCDLSKYQIKTRNGGNYSAFVELESEQSDPEYVSTLPPAQYWSCGNMNRWSDKYPVYSWSIDNRYCSRTGAWGNNLTSDYEYLYEVITGKIAEDAVSAEKFARLRERRYLTDDGTVGIMVLRGEADEFFGKIPTLDAGLRDRFADTALQLAMAEAKQYPPQMQDAVVASVTGGFFGGAVAVMVLDILYSEGILRPLTDAEKVTAQLLMFCDTLPR